MEALTLYRRLALAQVRGQMQYRASFLLDLAGNALGTVVDFVAVWVFFTLTPSLGGWTLPEVAFLFGLSSIAFALADLAGSGFDYPTFGPTMVRQGGLDQVLTRPVNAFVQILASQVVLRRLGRLVQGALILAIALPALTIPWDPARLVLVGLVVLGGAALFFGLFVLGATASFWTIEGLEALNTLTYGGQMFASYPIPIFPNWLRAFFTFVVPMACVVYFPAVWLLGKPDATGHAALLAWLSPLVCLLACLACILAWHAGLRHYQSTGS